MSNTNAQGIAVDFKNKQEPPHAKDLENVLLVAIRMRGQVNKSNDVKKTLALLRLHRSHHAVLLKATKPVNGMLAKVKDFIAFGPIDKPTLIAMLKKRGQLQGRRPLPEDGLKKLAGVASWDELADALMTFKLDYPDIKKIVPVFRLHPARGGFYKGIKTQFSDGGALGFHGNDINALVEKML